MEKKQRKKKIKKKPLDVHFKISKEDKEILKKKSEARNLNMSQYIIELIRKDKVIKNN